MDLPGAAAPDDDEVVTDLPETAPIYQYRSWVSKSAEPGMECCSTGYCFLCHNIIMDAADTVDGYNPHSGAGAAQAKGGGDIDDSDDEDDDDNQDRSIAKDIRAIKTYIELCLQQDKPCEMIVDGVADYYNRKVRNKVPPYYDSVENRTVENPAWTRETIVRHLMFSSDPSSSKVFQQACTMMLRGLVLKANEAVVDKTTRRINTDAAKMLCEFIDRHNKHTRESLVISGLVYQNKERRLRGGSGGVGHAGKGSSQSRTKNVF